MISLAGNTLISALKLTAGFIYGSAAVISDALHSVSDIFVGLLLLFGLKVSQAPADAKHNYGHEKIEAVITGMLATVLVLVGGLLAYGAVQSLIDGTTGTEHSPVLLVVMGVSVLMKEAMFQIANHAGKKYGSPALKADAWNHRSDAIASLAVLLGLAGAMLFPHATFFEPVATLIVALFIVKAAISIYLDAVNKLIDRAADPETVNRISDIVRTVHGVQRIDSLKTRRTTYHIYVDLEIACDGALSLEKAHSIAQEVHDTLEHTYKEFCIKHIHVHVNPL